MSNTVVMQRQSQALPALASFFVPGLGQLIQGRMIASFAWFCICLCCALSMLALIGFVLYPIAVLLCVVDAAKFNPKVVRVRA